MRYLKQAIKDGYLAFHQQDDKVIYLPQGKSRTFSNPEEQVQVQIYLSLIYQYGYPPTHIRVCKKIQIGSSTREGDIIVFKDERALDPLVIIECKKNGVADSVFNLAIDQGFSYAAATNAEYVWATTGSKHAVFRCFDHAINERTQNKLHRIPTFREINKSGSGIIRALNRWAHSPLTTDTLLFNGVLFTSMLICSGLAVMYHPEIRAFLQPYWSQFGMDYRWIFNSIALISTMFSLVIGITFMRSHKLFGQSRAKRKLVYLLITMILFLPVFLIAQQMSNPQWWSPTSYLSREFPILVYLWPYTKSVPFQFVSLYILIWLSSRRN